MVCIISSNQINHRVVYMVIGADSLETLHKFLLVVSFAAGSLSVGAVWIWKMSKEHSKVSGLKEDQDSLKETVESIEERLEQFITIEQHNLMQRQCQDHIAKEQADKLHAAILAMKNDSADIREDMAVMNANICKLLGRFDVEPVKSKERRRRTDVSTGAVL